MTNEEIWQGVLGEIELSISPASFTTWFKGTRLAATENGLAIIHVPNGFAKEWLENKFGLQILRSLRSYEESIKEIKCLIKATNKPIDSLQLNPAESGVLEQSAKEGVSSLPKVWGQETAGRGILTLNHRYTFENYIIGTNNELARAACEAVSRNLGKIYNPLFIYGGVGLGKTHLLQAIGNTVVTNDPKRKIIYSTSERFTNDLVDMIKTQNIREFKKPYLDADLLIIDDIQFIAGKEKTQDEFFHIFNTLYQMNKQIVLSSDRPPKAIATLEERLRSRFEGGMIADITRPDLETRMAILKQKSIEKGFEVEDEILSYLATNIQHNVRELEGALNRIMVSCELKKTEPSLSNVKKILSDIIHSGRKKGVGFKQIIHAVADFYDLSGQDLINRSRRKDIVRPRQVAMFLMRSELQASYPGIGEELGGRDHTTAIHAYEKISKELEQNEGLEQEINLIRSKIYTN